MKIKKSVRMLPAVFFLLMLLAPNLCARGHFEFGFHYSKWSIDILRGMIEEGISDALETDLKDRFLEDLREDHPGLQEVSYSQEVSFDSGGDNYGFEIRWYPGGENGSFSLGFSVEKTSMRVTLPEVSASLELTDLDTGKSASFSAAADGELLIKPLSFHLSFRWDIIPSSFINPYITLGFGMAGGSALEEGTVTYSYVGDLSITGETPEKYEGGDTKSIKELKDDLEEEGEGFVLPGFVPFIQLNLGLKGKINDNLHILVDAGVWNGFLIRGGIALRL